MSRLSDPTGWMLGAPDEQAPPHFPSVSGGSNQGRVLYPFAQYRPEKHQSAPNIISRDLKGAPTSVGGAALPEDHRWHKPEEMGVIACIVCCL